MQIGTADFDLTTPGPYRRAIRPWNYSSRCLGIPRHVRSIRRPARLGLAPSRGLRHDRVTRSYSLNVGTLGDRYRGLGSVRGAAGKGRKHTRRCQRHGLPADTLSSGGAARRRCTADDLLPAPAKNARRILTDAEVVTPPLSRRRSWGSPRTPASSDRSQAARLRRWSIALCQSLRPVAPALLRAVATGNAASRYTPSRAFMLRSSAPLMPVSARSGRRRSGERRGLG